MKDATDPHELLERKVDFIFNSREFEIEFAFGLKGKRKNILFDLSAASQLNFRVNFQLHTGHFATRKYPMYTNSIA